MSLSTSSVADLTRAFDDLQARIYSYELAHGIMDYDSQTQAPVSGAADSARAQSLLFAAKHELESSDETGELLAALAEHVDELDDLHRDELRYFTRTYNEERLVPSELVEEYHQTVSSAFPIWRAAKENNDFASFAPCLERVFDLLRERARCINPDIHPYDVHLDHWQRGNSMQECDKFFSQVSQTVVPLVRAISEQGERAVPAFATAAVPAEVQERLAHDISIILGIDDSHLVLGHTEHPFSIDFGLGDVRIAYHYLVNDALCSVATSCHETGHALYMQNIDPMYSFTCLHGGVECGIHEGQSRLMENNVGRSRAFMPVLQKLLVKHAPQVYEGVSTEELYRACNVVKPGLIRTMADELTYPLHIMVRYECEKRVMAGEIGVADIPTVWHDLMREHLGVEVPNDTMGCLQDMHWAADYVGYFVGYAQGNAYAAQLMHHARRAYDGDFDAAISRGDLSCVNGWLKEHVWRHGRSLDPLDLMAQACGEPANTVYYTDYLVEKFSDLYGIAR